VRWLLAAALVLFYLLHNDWWLWDDPTIVLGLPVGLSYHLGYCLAASLLMWLVVRFDPPRDALDAEAEIDG
jgi:hypothetical protein